MISHVEQIVRSVPEVESTSRRTGLQLGLAAVTEPNTGDISVKLKDKRSRGIDEIISEVRAKVKTAGAGARRRFHQVLQDMIGDLTGAPQPIVVKLFLPTPICSSTWAPRVADALGQNLRERQEAGGGYRGRHRKHHQRPGRGVHRQSRRPRPRPASPPISSPPSPRPSWTASRPPLR